MSKGAFQSGLHFPPQTLLYCSSKIQLNLTNWYFNHRDQKSQQKPPLHYQNHHCTNTESWQWEFKSFWGKEESEWGSNSATTVKSSHSCDLYSSLAASWGMFAQKMSPRDLKIVSSRLKTSTLRSFPSLKSTEGKLEYG